MKQRFSSLDVKVVAHELSASLVTLRLANVYDLSSRIFLLKFAKPDHREQFIIDSGFRCHLTKFSRATAAAPSPFVARLRKFLRTRRVTAVSQVGTDRVIEIQFSDGAFRLFLEFYAGGNIVLTDGEFSILALLRSVGEGAEHEQYRVGLKYNLSLRQNYEGVPPLTKERLRDGLQKAVEKQEEDAQKPGKKIKKKPGDALRRALAVTTTEYPPILIDHALHVASIDRQLQPEEVVKSDELSEQVLRALDEARRVIEEITSENIAKGYILARPKKGAAVESTNENEGDRNENLIYEDFHPFKPAQLAADESNTFLEYEGFNSTVDEFFSSIEGQKLESRLQERENTAKRRLEQARDEQNKRIDGLQQVQELNIQKAQAIEANVERVEEAVAAVNGLIAQGMDWVDIGRLIENEQSRRNPVAEMIRLPLKLHENTVTLLLSEFDHVDEAEMADETDSEHSDSEDENAQSAQQRSDEKRLTVDIDLALSAWSNARQYYDQKRTAAIKQERTAQSSQKALKSTEQKIMADLKRGLKQEKEVLRPVRKQFWFEKFIYFVSSDGYLVLAGKDAQQNEILYRRYLKKGDIYIHADLHGAATVIIKNNPSTPEAPIPPSTLSQAGNLAVCTSNAWDSKAVMSAWWVHSDQVSKTAPTGEYLTTGGFMVRGKKNYLPPAQLLLGFAVLFQISEESKARHVKHRFRNPETFPDTPDLTDGETIAESSIAGDGESAPDSSDDDFPDAAPGPAPRIEEDEDDDFPDVSHAPPGLSDEESVDTRRQRTYGSLDDDADDEDRAPRSNPLQTNGISTHSAHHGSEEEGDDEQGDDHDDNDADSADEDEPADAQDNLDDESTATPGTAAPTEKADDDDDDDGQPRQLSNKERKALARAEKTAGQPNTGPKVKPSKHMRGKKAKAKKIATKYADQDEEDRELAMKLLGSRAAEDKRAADAAATAAKAESAAETRARRRAQHEKAQREGLEAEEVRRLNLEEGVETLDDPEAAASLSHLDALVGSPLPGDEILDVIPVCAPWTALSKYKYKVKLQPGQQKKGKAVRDILTRWQKVASDAKIVDPRSEDTERIWPREVELLKGLREAEVVGVIPVKQVRIMISGGAGADRGKSGKGGKKGGKGGKKR